MIRLPHSLKTSFLACILTASLINCGPDSPQPARSDIADSVARQDLLLQAKSVYGQHHDKYLDVEKHISSFPWSEYKLVSVDGQGKFYVDSTSDFIKGILAKGEQWEPQNLEIIRRHAKPGTIAIDAGAHIGTMSIPLAKQIGPTGKVYSFEPQPKTFRELVLNAASNDLHNMFAFRLALGSQPGEIELGEMGIDNEGGTGLFGGNSKHIKAGVITIDSLKLNNVSFIKIDVEGFETYVLEGAKETILRNKPVILVEIMGGYDYDTAEPQAKAKIDATRHTLHELGYTTARTTPHGHDYLATPL